MEMCKGKAVIVLLVLLCVLSLGWVDLKLSLRLALCIVKACWVLLCVARVWRRAVCFLQPVCICIRGVYLTVDTKCARVACSSLIRMGCILCVGHSARQHIELGTMPLFLVTWGEMAQSGSWYRLVAQKSAPAGLRAAFLVKTLELSITGAKDGYGMLR